MTEYRIEELAAVTQTTVRTLQSYRNKGLLPPPRRQGRIALYSDDHVARLDLIADLIARGYSLNAASEVLAGLGRGDRIRDLLGLDDTIEDLPAADRFVTIRQLAAGIGEDAEGVGANDERIAELIQLGVIRPTDEPFDGPPEDRPHSIDLPAVLSAGTALVAAGVPLAAVLEEGARLQRDARVMAKRLVELVVHHVIDEGAIVSGSSAPSVTDLVQALVPHATTVVAELVEVALRDSIHGEIARQIGHLLTAEGADTEPGLSAAATPASSH